MALDTAIEKLDPGLVLKGRYRLLEQLGKGSMGEVWRCWDHQAGSQFAIKLLPKAEEFKDNELEAAKKMAHPNLVMTYGHFDDVLGSEMRDFLIMDYVPGLDLFSILHGKDGRGGLSKPVSPRTVAVIAYFIAQALNGLHSQEIAHLDIKPRNILISKDGELKITDYGIAKNIHDPSEELFFGGSTVGTALYCGEEQFYSLKKIKNPTAASRRSDLYALGATLYELLTKKQFASRWLPPKTKLSQEEMETLVRKGLRDTSLEQLEEDVWYELTSRNERSPEYDALYRIVIGLLKSARVKDREKEDSADAQMNPEGIVKKTRTTPLANRMSKREARHLGAYTDITEFINDLQTKVLDRINPVYGDIEREEGDVSYVHRLESHDLRGLLFRACYRERPIEEFEHLFRK